MLKLSHPHLHPRMWKKLKLLKTHLFNLKGSEETGGADVGSVVTLVCVWSPFCLTSPHIFQQRIILARWGTALFDIFVHISYYVHRYFILLFQHDA